MASVASGHFFEHEDKLPRSLVFGNFPGSNRDRADQAGKLPITPFHRTIWTWRYDYETLRLRLFNGA